VGGVKPEKRNELICLIMKTEGRKKNSSGRFAVWRVSERNSNVEILAEMKVRTSLALRKRESGRTKFWTEEKGQ